MKSVFVMWQDLSGTRMWHPVAKLIQHTGNSYSLTYTKGANHKSFTVFPNMEDKTKTYTSNQLFTFFKNRLMPESRPEHDSMFEWSGLSADSKDYLELLGISGGEKRTDHYRIVNLPEKTDCMYRIKFFVSSINYLNSFEKDSLKLLKVNDILKYQFDECNSVDDNATILLKENNLKVGYIPHYLCSDLKKLSNFIPNEDDIKIQVLKLNFDAPAQFKVLCELTTPWLDNFKPFDDEEFENI